MANAKPVPDGFRTITPYMVLRDAARAIDFYQRAFGATEVFRSTTPDGRIGHAELKIGDSVFMLADEFPYGTCRAPESIGGTTFSLWIYTEDVDALFTRATQAGATVQMPVDDMFWGDRFGQVSDPFGHSWSLATHKEDLTEEELRHRAQEAMAKMSQAKTANS